MYSEFGNFGIISDVYQKSMVTKRYVKDFFCGLEELLVVNNE